MNDENSRVWMDIAIVGMAGRFPGAPSVKDLWTLIAAGKEALTSVSLEESVAGGLAETTYSNADYVATCARLDDVDLFDAAFFGYSPKQAAEIDPQQRIFLETAWEALEDSGCDPNRFAGQIGLFAGTGANRYSLRTLHGAYQRQNMLDILQQTINADKDFLSTRASYKLDLRGPSLTLQTACSTSLVAVHVACQSLCLGECDAAIAGGVSISVPQGIGYIYQEGGILSPDGHCRPFDARALGTVPGSGIGLVVLRRLEDAVRSGDRIYSVIKNSSINNDGSRKVGYTAPSVDGQVAVIRQALGEISPQSIGMVEAHGTGTVLGDAVELAALNEVFRTGQGVSKYCALGSIKANIGHLDAAAGIAGLIKAALCLHHRSLVPVINVDKPNAELDFGSSAFYLNPEFRAWVRPGAPRRAAVSSFGMGGTNAHVILEEAPESVWVNVPRSTHIFPLSARDPAALQKIALRLASHLRADPALALQDVAYTLQTGRKHFPVRRAFVGGSREDLASDLETAFDGHVVTKGKLNELSFVFADLDLGRHANIGLLYALEAPFRLAFDDCARRIHAALGFDLRSSAAVTIPASEAAASPYTRDINGQLTKLVADYCIAKLLVDYGAEPTQAIGVGLGELSAACFTQLISIEQAGALLVAIANRHLPDVFRHAVEGIEFGAARIPLRSAFSDESPTESAFADVGYWLERCPTLGASALADEDANAAIRGLSIVIRCESLQTWLDGAVLPTDARAAYPHLLALANLWIYGAEIDWDRVHGDLHPRRVSLPTYPFERQRYWLAESSAFSRAAFNHESTVVADGALPSDCWFHLPAWKISLDPEACVASQIAAPGACWLIFADGSGIADALVKRITAAGGAPILVRSGTAFAETGACGFVVNLDDPTHLEELMRRLRAAGKTPDRLIQCVGPDEPSPAAGETAFWPGLERGAVALVATIQTLMRVFPKLTCDMCVVTHHVMAQPLDNAEPSSTALPALATVISQELPSVLVTIVDLPVVDPNTGEMQREEYLDWILAEIVVPRGDPVVAYRDGRRLVRTFENLSIPANRCPPRNLRKNGTYVITGGLGRIGLELAQSLSRDYHAKLLLISRSGMPDPQSWPAILDGTPEHAVMQSKIRALHNITAAGGQFLIAAADVTNEHDVRSAIANAELQFGPINGAFHLAGLLDDASARTAILKLARGDFIVQAKAKLAGFWVLDRVLGEKRLDFGVLFGSIAAVLGGVGFGAYASINACFDAVAARRDGAAGVPWICCAWDEWRESESDFSSPLALTMAEGVRSLWLALGSAPSSSVVISKSSVAKRFDALRQERLARPQRAAHPAAAASAVSAVAPRPADPDLSPPLNDIQRVLAEIWASSLGVDRVGMNDDFFALGGDSMIMLDMLARIEDTFHVEVPLRSFLQSELTVAALARAVEQLAEPSSTT